MVAQNTTSTDSDSQSTLTSDRRRSERQERATPAWISAASTCKTSSGFNITVRDLSLHGVGINSKKELKKNDIHWLVIADQSLRLSTRIRIVSCRQRDDSDFEVGAEFF